MIRGVYIDTLVEDSLPLRAAAVAKVAPPDAVVCRRTAAWLYGVDVLALQELAELPSPDFVRPTDERALRSTSASGHSQTLLTDDVIDWGVLRVTSPLATAVHLARHLQRPFALSALDAMARAELITLDGVQNAVRRYPHHPGIVQARELVNLVDPAAESPGESWLRLRMIDAGFPHPVPQVRVSDGVNAYRLDLGFLDPLPGTNGRHLGLEYDSDQWHGTAERREADTRRRRRLDGLGWEIVSVRRWQLWSRENDLEQEVGRLLGIRPQQRTW
ncbi:hypothetical protein [Kribbella deserti]|uniref:Restriction endonuclease type II-like domain-containing protein n=1 Tax=Kribbella deserti TaxID=1926257 RepID=A0ABV6QTB0_9ACTN